MVTCLPELEKVLLTGDAYQLPAYAYHLKGQVLDGGLESVITAVQRRKTVPTSALSISYRPHPALVEVQKALYNDRLKSGLTQEQRNLLASVGFPLPNAAIPLVLINTPHEHQRAACGSRYNLEQEELVLDLLAHLRSQFPVASIVTKERWFPLTRPREALFILGDIDFLAAGCAWSTFFANAVRKTHIVDAKYIRRLTTRESVTTDDIRAPTSFSMFPAGPVPMNIES
ncbi:hypothetical protein QR680_010755 [Steinernema hermaphroditum]|uniref:DNA2/NAM7 helicase-like C-terminal domain-containing protein n=1 Tax=Steinernema hermaphroditum TaxID=289476 RepID=A0AA39IRI7_9BILA|nr:hypothetical protein QR680_010755 [Steinernema hermaphroditum]